MNYEALTLDPLTLLLAWGAGALSFVSPCVLPLLPAYLGYMTGLSTQEIAAPTGAATRARVLGRSVAFVLGLSAVFTLLGASASLLGQLVLQHQTFLLRIAGLIVIAFGLHTLGLIRIPLLFRASRADFGHARGGYPGALLMGAAFAIGWTPCVGPFLAALLALAGQEHTVARGMLLLFVYGLGLGVPFVLAGLALGPALRLLQRVKARMQAVEIASGLLIVGMGVLIFTDRLALISAGLTALFGTGLAA